MSNFESEHEQWPLFFSGHEVGDKFLGEIVVNPSLYDIMGDFDPRDEPPYGWERGQLTMMSNMPGQHAPFGRIQRGGGTITLWGRWAPDPHEPTKIAQELVQLANYYEDTTTPLVTTELILREDTRQRFMTETDPSGHPWEPLDPDYLATKLADGYPENILVRTTKMFKAATSAEAWIVTKNSVMFNPEVLPRYSYLHQFGSGNRVGEAALHRERVRSRREGFSQDKDYRGSIHGNLGIGRGNALPARPFIGISSVAIQRIVAAFDDWFNTGKERFFVSPFTGTVQRWQYKGNVRLFGKKVRL